MASLIYDSCIRDSNQGDIDYNTDTFWAMLVTVTYAPNQATHTKRSDVTNEVSGTGYSAGGQAITATPSLDTGNHRFDVAFSAVTWPSSSITAARAAVIYKRRGGASSADELVAYVDFGADKTSSGGDFVFTPSSPLRFQN